MGCLMQIGYSVLEPWKSLHRTIVLVFSPGDKIDVTVSPKIPLAVTRCEFKPMKVNESIYWDKNIVQLCWKEVLTGLSLCGLLPM